MFIAEKRLPQNSRNTQKFIAEKKTPTDFTDLHRSLLLRRDSHRIHGFTQKFIAEKKLPQISQNSQKFIAEKRLPQISL